MVIQKVQSTRNNGRLRKGGTGQQNRKEEFKDSHGINTWTFEFKGIGLGALNVHLHF